MSEADPEKKPDGPATDDPSRGDYLAMGIGCLVFVILFGAAIYLGMSRG
jgi:hypothetical protein